MRMLTFAGRNTKEDELDFSAGIILKAKTGDKVNKGETIAVLYANDSSKFSLYFSNSGNLSIKIFFNYKKHGIILEDVIRQGFTQNHKSYFMRIQ